MIDDAYRRDLRRNLTEWATALPNKALRHCHATGITSIVLNEGREDDGTKRWQRRIFIAHRDEHQLDELHRPDGHFNVGVHNHRYPLSLEPVCGEVWNYKVRITGRRTPVQWYEHQFQSGILGEFGFTPTGRDVFVLGVDWQLIGEPTMISMQPWDLHTVLVPKTRYYPLTAWMVTEGSDHFTESLMYSPVYMPVVDPSGLYEPMTVNDAEKELENLLKVM